MKKIIYIIFLFFAISALIGIKYFMNLEKEKTLKLYLPYTLPVDPAKITTTADLELSYALASTLVEWNENRQITSSLAKTWK